MNNFENIRESFYSIEIGNLPESVWIKKLRNILNSDIHNRPLGCKIDNTHIKIGDVHLGSFYEAQLLFSHAKWIHRFAEWISKQLSNESEKYLIVGYETYIEPVLSILHNKRNFDYCIYEEPKYIQRNTMSKARLRYSESIRNRIDKGESNYSKVVFLCGISSTLSTYKKLEDFFVSQFGVKTRETNFSYYSIIQVLPHILSGDSKFLLNDTNDVLRWDRKAKKAFRNNDIVVNYLVDVECEWQKAQNCKWCFPNNVLDERPLITTDESSVIPLQMIGLNANGINEEQSKQIKKDKLNFFKKEKGKYKYLDYLYYNHIDRDDHHFQYYIRTGSLFNKIMDEKTFGDFVAFCTEVRNGLSVDQKSINIIVTPLHFSNERFSHEINRLVFDNKAHIISFDSKKEYRSNFETKYSNYAYVLEQISSAMDGANDSELLHEINFYFVDDQLITGNTFYKAKSFASSLMRKYLQKENNMPKYKIFSAVITLIDRNSNSTKLNYVKNSNDFFSFINIPIPSIRSYGDSCPLCKQIIDSQNISDNCTLDVFSKYWIDKAHYHKKKTIEEAKKLSESTSQRIKTRHFVRFYCECVIWKNIKHLWDEKSILYVILSTIHREIKALKIKDQYEYLISFLKVTSRPFLFYRENVKKAVLKILLLILNEVLIGNVVPVSIIETTIEKALKCDYIIKGSKIIKVREDKLVINENIQYELYCLVCVLVSCLSNVESSYILNVDHISTLCDFITQIDPSYAKFGKLSFDPNMENDGFYSIIVNNFKKLICGTSGIEKSKAVEEQLINSFHGKYAELFKVLYLENIRHSKEEEGIDNRIIDIQDSQINTILKYESIGKLCKENIAVDSCLFFLSYGKGFKSSKVAEIFDNTRVGEFDLIFQKMMYDKKDENALYNSLKEIGCFEHNYQHFLISLDNQNDEHKDTDTKTVLMLLSFENSKVDNYTAVKKWLIHRKQIKKIIEGDIKTGALESAIRAKAAEYVLSTDKTQSHGQSNDINKLFEFVYEKFINARNKDEDTVVSAYQGINLFINRCIAFGATKQIFQEYFDLNNIKYQLQPFSSCMQKIYEPKDKSNLILDLKKYFEIITKENSKYIEQIKKEVINKRRVSKDSKYQNVTITFGDSFLALIDQINYVPLFIDSPYELANSAVFLIGIIDVFIRNAIEHGPDDCDVQLRCALGDDVIENRSSCYNYNNSYSISVTNNCVEDEHLEEGFTKKFFTQYLFKEKDKYSFFYITMDKKSNNTFEAKLTCIIKDIVEGM